MAETIYLEDVSARETQAEAPPREVMGQTANNSRRARLFAGLFGVAAVVGLCVYGYDVLVIAKHVTTDNAYVGADVAQVTPLVAGPVKEVLVQDTQMVRRGDVLVRLDDTDAAIALARAQANLIDTERKVRGIVDTTAGLTAQIAARIADQARAQAQVSSAKGDLERARIDLTRRQDLAASGSVSGEELTSAQNAFTTAEANLKAAEATLASAKANRVAASGTEQASSVMVGDGDVANNPEVLAAKAERDQAQVNLDRTVIRAPVDGVVSRRDVQVGQRVQAGATLMMIAPIGQAYVDANFKEVQLAKVRPGQPVILTSDLYGDHVKYHGRVMGFSGGTGAAFAVVPAQNATGNWIKVVQRLPVRIALDPGELRQHPLRVGLSMNADINVSR
jgi:membrane fusion protein (multidrug efflux system)